MLLGAPVGDTTMQVFAAFLGSTAFYILRRTTGSLIWAMVLHGVWDFSVFATGVGHEGDIAAIANVAYLFTGIMGLACVAFVIRGANERLDVSPAPATSGAGISAG
ncbi:type II CAAX prenyl endopeptidase Rce1 family protein [Agromyces sp. NPDC056389]|uniref:CPBP family glutamic-type intramembrane protease n=1 Tax=Agromyces sp. NPDC056389 TaxID=3345805 RepID=UPI0035DD595B